MLRARAEKLLTWAGDKNPGPWTAHSERAADAAFKIARECGLDAERAYVSGLLHDVGRYEGATDLRHIYTGYELLVKEGFGEIAQIALTHSFPFKDIGAYSGKNDCSPEETAFIIKYLSETEFGDYDALIQLCDALASPEGVNVIEVRLTDVATRHGFNEFTIKKWDATLKIKKYFDRLCGKNIYSLFRAEMERSLFE